MIPAEFIILCIANLYNTVSFVLKFLVINNEKDISSHTNSCLVYLL